MPWVVDDRSWDLFEAQPQSYRDEVLPPQLTARLAVEFGVRQGWDRYIGTRGDMIGVDRFGASAPAALRSRKPVLAKRCLARATSRSCAPFAR